MNEGTRAEGVAADTSPPYLPREKEPYCWPPLSLIGCTLPHESISEAAWPQLGAQGAPEIKYNTFEMDVRWTLDPTHRKQSLSAICPHSRMVAVMCWLGWFAGLAVLLGVCFILSLLECVLGFWISVFISFCHIVVISLGNLFYLVPETCHLVGLILPRWHPRPPWDDP